MRLSQKIEGWINDAVESQAQGDDITFDFTFMPGMMQPNGQSTPPGYFIAMAMPTGLVDISAVSMASMSNGLAATEDDCKATVTHLIETLRQQRTDILSRSPEKFDPDQFSQPQNGKAGLHLPPGVSN